MQTVAAERSSRAIVAALTLVMFAFPLLLTRTAQAAPGRIREFVIPTKNSHPGGISLGSDGSVWFTQIATNAIGRLQGRTTTTFPLPQGGLPNAIVSGPDGALWFTEYSGNRIGRMTIAGATTQFDLPSKSSSPISITNGPDGALWFTNQNGVGRITIQGTVSQPWSGATSPSSITTGPDHRLWFTESSQDVIGRLDPSSGQIRQFPIDINCFPQDIASGSGALWFTCYFLDEVGRITTDGQATAFPVPNHFGGAYPDTLEGIATGAGNDMWFTEEAANRIGRITTS